MGQQSHIVVFTGDLSFSVRKGIVEIDRALPGLSWLVLIHSPRRIPRRLLKSQWRNVRRNGLRWIPHRAASLWGRWSEQRGEPRAPSSPGINFVLSSMESNPNMRFARVTDVHAPDSLQQVKDFVPDLGLALAAPILRPRLFQIPRLGTVNLHKGKLPDYRGMPPAFWELWNDEQSVGCTVHWVHEKLDTGDVISQTTIKRERFSTVRGLQLQLDEIGVDLMCRAVRDILLGTATRHTQTPCGRTYRKPTLAEVAGLERRLLSSQTPNTPFLTRGLKSSRSALAWSCWHLGLGRLLAPRVVVLLYHRVSDDARDLLTVGIEQFDRQMTLVRRHCTPFSIPQLLENPVVPRSANPLVAITFDDGYLDNYANAVPILIRHGIPAAFFVSTGILDSAGRFPHDVRLGNPHIPVMKWDHLRAMRDAGFTIGSHSVSHIDCAAEREDTVRAELAQSRDRLHQELGVTQPLFAYPYGGRQHMTTRRLELVKAASYAACLSAYGGSNIGIVDRYDIRRRGIHWEFSDRAFLFECLGWT